MCVSNKLGLPEVFQGPEQFTKLREACRQDPAPRSTKMDSMVSSYGHEPWGGRAIFFVHGMFALLFVCVCVCVCVCFSLSWFGGPGGYF